jgi:hypothetical protein
MVMGFGFCDDILVFDDSKMGFGFWVCILEL